MFAPIWSLSTYPWTLPIQTTNQALSCHHYILSKSSYPYTPTTSTFLQTDTQSSPILHSKCPNHLNLTFVFGSRGRIISKRVMNNWCQMLDPVVTTEYRDRRSRMLHWDREVHAALPFVYKLSLKGGRIFWCLSRCRIFAINFHILALVPVDLTSSCFFF